MVGPTTSVYYHLVIVLVTYCCVMNCPKTWQLKQQTFITSVSEGRESRNSSVGGPDSVSREVQSLSEGQTGWKAASRLAPGCWQVASVPSPVASHRVAYIVLTGSPQVNNPGEQPNGSHGFFKNLILKVI